MKCAECSRYSLDAVCSVCLTRPRLDVARRPGYVAPAVERTGLLCPCGETEPMRPEVGHWILRPFEGWAPWPYVTEERLLWYRCGACGSITRETLLPVGI